MKIPVMVREEKGHWICDIPRLDVLDYVGETQEEVLGAALSAAILEVGIRLCDKRLGLEECVELEFDIQDISRTELMN